MNTVITLYGLKMPERKIATIKTLRALASIDGAILPLKVAKDLVDNIDRHPISVCIIDVNTLPIARAAIDMYFTTEPPERNQPVSLAQFYRWPEPEIVTTMWGDPVCAN